MDARSVGREAVAVGVPVRAPAGVNEHGVSGLQRDLLAIERLLQVVNGDLVALGQHRHAFQGRHVDEHPARHEGADVLDAQPREP